MTGAIIKNISRRSKSEAAFRTISEVSGELSVPQHVLRFWESKFTQIKPMKRGGGRRYYRPEDLVLLTRIRDLLYKDGFTIKGAQKHLREMGKASLLSVVSPSVSVQVGKSAEPIEKPLLHSEKGKNDDEVPPEADAPIDRKELGILLDELLGLRSMLIEARK